MLIRLLILIIVFAQAEVNAQKPPKLQIVTEHLPPFQVGDEQGNVTGFATEVMTTALALTDIEYAIKIYPWTRAYNKVKTDSNTCIYSIARTPERESLLQWTQPIASTDSTLIGLAENNDLNVTSLEDAKNYKIAVIRDDVTHQILLNNGFEEGRNLYIVNNTFSLLKLLVRREEIDLIFADIVTVKYRALHDKLDPSIFKPYLKLNKKPLDFYFACNLSTPKSIVDQINQAILNIKQSGQHQAIISKWR